MITAGGKKCSYCGEILQNINTLPLPENTYSHYQRLPWATKSTEQFQRNSDFNNKHRTQKRLPYARS
jgi:hypothetical protein